MAHIFIGIGGTGNGVLKKLADKINANQRLISELRSKPDVVFWLIDCDEMPRISNIPVINTTLQVIDPEKAQDYDYKNDPEFRKWFDPYYRTKGHINGKDSPGAGQIKMSGRYAFTYDIEKIQKDSDRLLTEPGIDFKAARVHIITSLTGGTGAGMVYDVAYLIKQKAADINLYLLEPSFLKIVDAGRKNVYSWNSAYASLIELDFWMSNNPQRSADQQFNMTYKNRVHVNDNKPVGYPAYLFGGTDQFGRSLAATGKKVHDVYQEFIASVLFERSFNNEFSKYLQKNIIDNFEGELSNDPSGHSRAFSGFGITYLRFPKEKLYEYFKNDILSRFIMPKFVESKKDLVEINSEAATFLSQKIGVAEKENKQLTTLIYSLPSAKAIRNASDSRIKKINAAKSNKEIPREQTAIDFNKFENESIILLNKLFAGDKTNVNDIDNINQGFIKLLEKEILNMLSENRNLPDIINFVKHIWSETIKDKNFLEKYYSSIIDQFYKKNLEDEINKLYNRLLVTKTNIFSSKDFNKTKQNFLRSYKDYIEGKNIISWYRHSVDLLERMGNESKKWIQTLEYIKLILTNVVGDADAKTREALSKFKKGLFIYDKILGEKNYVFELHIGDSKGILNSKLVQKFILEPIKTNSESILKTLMKGSLSMEGIELMIKDIYNISEAELNENQGEYQKKCSTLLEKFVYSEIKNKVNAIGLKEVLDWQLGEIYLYVKNLENNKKYQYEEYERTNGKMNAMFGTAGTLALLKDLQNAKTDEWKENAKNHLISNIKDVVHPLWMINESGKDNVRKPWYYIVFPQGMEIPDNIKTGEDEQNSEWHDDRIVFMNVSPGIRLNELENLDDFKNIYLKQMKLKRPPNVSKTSPIFTDYRFYTEWEWDLDMDVTQQADAKTLQYFAFGLTLKDDEKKTLIDRRKAKSGYSFWYVPGNGYKGKNVKKLGDGLAKSYESLNKDLELREHFKARFKEVLNKNLYAVPDDQRFNLVLEMIQQVQKKWVGLRPPEIPENRAVKSGGNPISRAYFYWKKTSDWLSELTQKINHQNYQEHLL